MRFLLLAALAAATPFAVAQDAPADGPTVVDVLAADGRFSTLLGALEATGLAATLAEAGPFTVFAPTDSAFAALPEGTLDALSAEDLTGILLGHVVIGAVPAAAAAEAGIAQTASSDRTLAFSAGADGGLLVDGVSIDETDREAANGIIHVVGAVLLPPPAPVDGDGM